jgi:PKD repeat protein
MPTTPRAKSGKILRTLLLCATAVSWLSVPAAAQKSISRLAQLSGSDFRVALSISPTVPIQGQPVSFTGASTGDVRFWLWDFGDGSTSTRQNEVHSYRTAGFYKVSLTATSSTGTKKTLRTVPVMPEALAASFVFSPTSPRVGQTVSFADTTSGDPTSWAWDFGDGTTSSVKNPAHAYAKEGSYAVTLSATTASGMKKASRSLTVATMSILASSFSYAPASPTAGQSVQFTDTSTGSPTAWLWVFGDGLTSAAHNPIHVFSAPGSYSVTLTTTNSSGSKTSSRTVVVASGLTASFSFAPVAPSAGQSVQFTDTSTGGPTAWFWNFGDGSTSTLRHPSHAFTAAGSYTVSLANSNSSGSKGTSQTVVVTGAPSAASFTYTPAYPDVGQAVLFSDLSSGTPTSWQWNFNDGSTSGERNPSHAFPSVGTYNVSLVVSGPSGSASANRSVLVGSGIDTKGTYWVSPTGTAAWQSARSDTPLSGAACCSLSTANANAIAGDTVFLRAGTYSKSLAPARSGTAESRITFQAYGGEVPVFTVNEAGGRWAVKLQGVSYIKIDGIASVNSGAFFFVGYGACYNEITHCSFDRSSGDYQLGYITDWNSARNGKAATRHNWLHHNTFSRYGNIDYKTGEDLGTIRISSNYDDTTSYNTFEDNVFSYGGHDCIDIGGQYNVIRNNVFHNEDAYFKDITRSFGNVPSSGYFGNRNILLSNSGQNPGTAYHTLIEGNRIGYAGTPPDDDGSTGIENAGCHTLVRYNDIYGNGGMGYYSKMQPEGGQNTSLKSGSWARVYNNTIYHGGYGDASMYGDQFTHGVCIWSYTTFDNWPTNVVVKNNIVYANYQEWRVGSANILPQVTYANNFNADPGFSNPDMSDKTSLTLPDLSLVSGSACIDAGAALTQAKGNGSNSLTLVVYDSLLFQDGSWGSALTHGVTHFPDAIAIGTVTNVARIASIDYTTHTITLASALSWTDKDGIWLFSNSAGKTVLNGAAPDIGAHESEKR